MDAGGEQSVEPEEIQKCIDISAFCPRRKSNQVKHWECD